MNEQIWDNRASLARYLEEVVRFVSEKERPNNSGTIKRYRNVWNIADLSIVYDYIRDTFIGHGFERECLEDMPVLAQFGEIEASAENVTVNNLIVEIEGTTRPDEIVIIGAHYDSRVNAACQRGRVPVDPYSTVSGAEPEFKTPGANDNGSGIAALLALGADFADKTFARTVRFVAWVNEEFPFYAHTFANQNGKYFARGMGSYLHAERCASQGIRENIVGVISLDTMGCYPKKAYRYPGRSGKKLLDTIINYWLFRIPKMGNYVAFLSDVQSKHLMRTFKKYFEDYEKYGYEPNEIVRAEARSANWLTNRFLKKGAWSDDWSYWQHGYPGFIVTDMAYLRSPNYHRSSDIADNMQFEEFSKVVWRLRDTVSAFADAEF